MKELFWHCRTAAENAEIANQWKERSDAFEAAYEKQKAESAAAALVQSSEAAAVSEGTEALSQQQNASSEVGCVREIGFMCAVCVASHQ